MKKIIIAILMLSGTFSMVSADIGIKVGVSAQVGSMETSGKEVSSGGTTEKSKVREALFATGGMFIEKDLAFLPGRLGTIGSRISLGYDNIAHDLDLGSASNVRATRLGNSTNVGTNTASVNTVNAKVTGFSTVYATVHLTDWLYVKAGNVTTDIDIKYDGTETSAYKKNHELDGTVRGFGVMKTSESGLFFRLEYNDYDIDGKSVKNTGTDSKFTTTLNDVTGATGRISVGKAF